MLSTVDTSKSVPLGLFHTPIYMQLAVHLHHKKERLAEELRVMGTQMSEWVNAALLPSIAVDCPSRWPDAAQMCRVAGLTAL